MRIAHLSVADNLWIWEWGQDWHHKVSIESTVFLGKSLELPIILVKDSSRFAPRSCQVWLKAWELTN